MYHSHEEQKLLRCTRFKSEYSSWPPLHSNENSVVNYFKTDENDWLFQKYRAFVGN